MKTLTIQNTNYQLTDEAYVSLDAYLKNIRTNFVNQYEVVADIEMACIDLLDQALIERADRTLTESDVAVLIQKLGTVAMINDQSDTPASGQVRKRLYRDSEKKWLGGVAAGLAAYFDLPVWVVRFSFIIAIIAPLPSVIPYLILWFVVPATQTKADQLRMHGQPVSLSSLSNVENYTQTRVTTLAKIAAVLVAFFVLVITALFALALFMRLGLFSF